MLLADCCIHRRASLSGVYRIDLLSQVEYAGKVWDPQKYPFQTVARVVFPPQESFDYERKAFWEDHMRVDPWLGLESLRPLGSSNRYELTPSCSQRPRTSQRSLQDLYSLVQSNIWLSV